MKISVIVPTKRYGGLDIILSSLGGQIGLDKEDWEVIIIDDFINDKGNNRKFECFSYCKKFGVLNVIYLRSKVGYWRSNHLIANARNTGLIYAKGELVVFVDDYTRLPPSFLDEHWKVYDGNYTLIGGGVCGSICEDICNCFDKKYDSFDKKYDCFDKKYDCFDKKYDYEIIRNGIKYKQLPVFEDTRMFEVEKNKENKDRIKEDCGGGWFYTFNASAPLEKIIDINGFDEEFDLTREEDIDLGLRLEKVGCKFCYKFNWNCNVVHADHRFVDIMMKKEEMVHNKYKDITYDMLRYRGKDITESERDEVQLVLKEKYGIMYDGSWGLHEKSRNNGFFYANIVNGIEIFDLRKERRKLGL